MDTINYLRKYLQTLEWKYVYILHKMENFGDEEFDIRGGSSKGPRLFGYHGSRYQR